MKCAPICKDQTCRYWQKMPPEFEARYGNCVLRVANEGPKTLEFIAQIFGITRERVRQIEGEILKKIRAFLREEIPDFESYKDSDLLEIFSG